MVRRSKALILGLILGALLPASARAVGLPTPQGLQADSSAAGLTLHWQPVEGAALYRVALFDAPEADNKRPLLAAIWVRGTQYIYGQTLTVPRAGAYPSTKPLPLPTGRRLRAMVAAAEKDGSNKGEWAGLDVDAIPAPKLKPEAISLDASATPSPSPTASPSPTPGAPVKDAELDVQGGEEFKQTPDAAVLDVDEGTAEGAGLGVAGAAGVGAAATVASAAPASADAKAANGTDVGEAKGLLSAGRFEQAETAYRALLDKEPQNADYWEGLGDSFAGRKMKLEAKESYEKALSLNKAKVHLRDWIDKNVRR